MDKLTEQQKQQIIRLADAIFTSLEWAHLQAPSDQYANHTAQVYQRIAGKMSEKAFRIAQGG